MDDWKGRLSKTGYNLKRLALEVVKRHCDSEAEEAKEHQKIRDVELATQAFLELKQSDVEIYRLLGKYFKIDSIAEAESILKKAKVTSQIIKLREYMEAKGMSSSEFRIYAKEHNLEGEIEKRHQNVGY